MRFFWCRLRHRIWCRMESGSLKPSSLSSLSSSSLACCLCQGGGETTTWLAQWGNRLCEEAPAFFFSSALVVHALVPLSKALLSAPWGCCFVFVHIDVPLLPVWLLFTRFWWYGRLSVKLLLLRLFSSWLCSSPPFFLFIFDGMLFLSSGGRIFFFAMPSVPVYTLVSRDQKTKGPVCFIDVFFRLLLRLQVPALICSWGCISRCCLEEELNFLETFVHIVVEDMDSLRFFFPLCIYFLFLRSRDFVYVAGLQNFRSDPASGSNHPWAFSDS